MPRVSSEPKSDLRYWVDFGRKRRMSLAEPHSAVRVVECLRKSPSFYEKQMKATAVNFIRFVPPLYRALDPYPNGAP